jgi:hypothetical protein
LNVSSLNPIGVNNSFEGRYPSVGASDESDGSFDLHKSLQPMWMMRVILTYVDDVYHL